MKRAYVCVLLILVSLLEAGVWAIEQVVLLTDTRHAHCVSVQPAATTSGLADMGQGVDKC